MDYSPYADPSADPFRCLDSDLDEMLNSLHDPNLNAHQVEAMDTSSSSTLLYSAATPPSAYLHQSVVNGHGTSPSTFSGHPGIDANQFYYKQEHTPQPQTMQPLSIQPIHDPYALKFSPPDFDQMNGAGMGSRLLPQLGSEEKYFSPRQQQQQQQQQQSIRVSRMGGASDADIATLLTPLEQKLAMNTKGNVIVKRESSPPRATKEQLLKLLVSLTPAEVERLREGVEEAHSTPMGTVATPSPAPQSVAPPMLQSPHQHQHHSSVIAAVGRVRPSAVATRVPKTELPRSSFSEVVTTERRDSGGGESDLDDDDEEIGHIGGRRSSTGAPRTERRTAHNLIEKKYRCSINDRILALKNMLSGGAKMSKSATLRRAIEYIEELENKNRELSNSLTQISSVCAQNGIDTSQYIRVDALSHSPTGSASSPHMSSGGSNQTSPVPSYDPKRKRSRMSMDQGRVSLCAIMFAILVWNPIAALTPSSSSHSTVGVPNHIPARTLQSMDEAFEPSYSPEYENWWQDRVIRPCFVWSMNIFIVICVLTRLLVYGEPVQDFKSRTWASFLATKKQAQAAFDSENCKEAHRQLVECLQILERPLPYSFFDEVMAVIWQIIRHLLNGMWIGRWFARRRRDERKPVTVVCKSHAHTAMIYHQLNQLDLLGVDGDLSPTTRLRGLYLALSSVNLAESAGASIDGLPHAAQAHILMAAAIRCRLSLPSFIAPVMYSYFLRRSRRHIRKAPPGSTSSLNFLFHPLARKFCSDPIRLRSALEDISTSYFAIVSPTGLAIDRLRGAFKVHLLLQLLETLRVPNPAGSTMYSTLDIVDASQLLLSISTAAPSPASTGTFGLEESSVSGDAVSTWWAHVLTCGLLWRQDKNDQAKSHYAIVRRIPNELMTNPLAMAVGYAFCGRKLRSDEAIKTHYPALVRNYTEKALSALRAVPVLGGGTANVTAIRVQEGMRLLTLEWTMCSLLAAWRSKLDKNIPYWNQELPSDLRDLYQESYTMICISEGKTKTKDDDLSSCQLMAFNLTTRMLAGSNAVQTYSELLRLQRKVNEKYARLPSTRDDTALSYHLHVLTKLHLVMGGVRSKRN